ncbi:uncharacterized protein DUF2851 [Chitinophaga skermanii]|uniref:Uncharacterized protein DUF2851 n=1 Tax=Chitinophaga skermanii TaxID=331697 RepID=A0A327QDW8_9BACT|nr:DUF2851 family protein [Chitinophaga skermanii]RAJ02511.1 uncharacterized protein DUF2851 [Chitinophaga skermanii]
MKVNPLLNEALLQYIWQHGMFDQRNLASTAGDSLEIISPGLLNPHAGPDFSAAKIKIGGILWAGNVEIHLRSSDWHKHRHQRDPRYHNIILHVVVIHDDPSVMPAVPCIQLDGRIANLLLQRYQLLQQEQVFIPCEKVCRQVPSIIWQHWKERLLLERWQRKTATMQRWLQQSQYDWDAVCYRAIAQAAGVPVNSIAFEQLAQLADYKLLHRYSHNLHEVEALLFGQAGMLHAPMEDEYGRSLQLTFRYLQHKHQLQHSMPVHIWKWLRMRPHSFPTQRIAALAMFVHKHPRVFSQVIAIQDIRELETLFEMEVSEYWTSHYRFNIKAKKPHHHVGKTMVQNVLINTVLPLIFLYGQTHADAVLQERALQFALLLPPEKNSYMAQWAQIGQAAQTALDSQALLELRERFCLQKKCLQCEVGAKIMKG